MHSVLVSSGRFGGPDVLGLVDLRLRPACDWHVTSMYDHMHGHPSQCANNRREDRVITRTE